MACHRAKTADSSRGHTEESGMGMGNTKHHVGDQVIYDTASTIILSALVVTWSRCIKPKNWCILIMFSRSEALYYDNDIEGRSFIT